MLDEVDPTDPRVLQALGRAVVGSAALEKVLLDDVAPRHARRNGLLQELAGDLAHRDPSHPDRLFHTLVGLDVPSDLAERIAAVMDARNALIHRFTADPSYAAAALGIEVDAAIIRIERVTAECHALVNEVAQDAFDAAEQLYGRTLSDLLDTLHAGDTSRPA